MSSITVYSKSACVQCTATYRALDSRGISYTVVDLDQHPRSHRRPQGRGLLQAPAVVTDTDTWTGFRPDKIATLTA